MSARAIAYRDPQHAAVFIGRPLIGPGDLILLNPDQVHDGSSLHRGGWSSRMAYVPESTFAGLLKESVGDGHVSNRFAVPVLHVPRLADKFLRWHCATESAAEVHCSALAKEVFAELGDLMRCALLEPTQRFGSVGTSLALNERLRTFGNGGPPLVAKLVDRLDVSRTTTWRQMRARFGMGPQSVMTQLRLMSAKGELAAGRQVLEVALDAGYYDQSHFTRQFAAAYGMTPAQFRRAQVSVRQSP